MKQCPNGHDVSDDAKFCPICGTEIIDIGAKFCTECGTRVFDTKNMQYPNTEERVDDSLVDEPVQYDAEEDSVSKRGGAYILGIIALIVICGGGWWYYNSSHEQSSQEQPPTTATNDIDKVANSVDTIMEEEIVPKIVQLDYCEDMAIVIDEKNKFGFKDKNGDMIIPCIYDRASNFHEGMAQVQKDGKKGFVDKTGNIVIQCVYEDVTPFHEDYASARKDGRWGVIDRTGRTIVPFLYEACSNEFHSNLLRVMNNGKLGFVNNNGVLVIPCQYDQAFYFEDNMTLVQMREKGWGCINSSGKSIVPCKYMWDDIKLKDGLVKVKIGNRWYTKDENGNIITDETPNIDSSVSEESRTNDDEGTISEN